MAFIQAMTISGTIIENARFKVGSVLHLQVGHTVSICFNSENQNLAAYVKKHSKPECCLDESGNIVATFTVTQVRHMLDYTVKGDGLESMVIVTPANRHVESIVLFVFDLGKCDGRFVTSMSAS